MSINNEREAYRRRLMAMLAKNNIDNDARHDLCFAWTGGRTSSSRELTTDEMRDLVWKLENQFNRNTVELYLEAERKKLRAQVLKIATETGLKEPDGFDRFNRFMLSHSILKKELHKYTLEELQKLVKQFRGIEHNFKASAEKPGTKAWFHHTGIPEPNIQ